MGRVSLLIARNQIQPNACVCVKVFVSSGDINYTPWWPELVQGGCKGAASPQTCWAAGETLLWETRRDGTLWEFKHLVVLSTQWYLAIGASIV